MHASLRLPLVVALLASACLPAPPPAGAPCNDDEDCRSAQRCVEGVCADRGGPAVDAGTRSDGGPPPVDAGAPTPDAGTDAGAPIPDAGLDAGTPAVDGGFDAGSPPLPVRIVVTTDVAVNAGYAVRVSFDHAALVAALGLDDSGADLAVVALPAGSAVPFALAPGSAWNRSDTTIWFALAAPLPVDETARYALDVSAADGDGPASLDEVWIAGDDFEDGALSGSLTAFTNLGATITETGGGLVFDMSEDQAEAAVVSAAAPLPDDRRFTIRQRMRLDRVDGDDNSYNVKTIGIVQWETQPSYAPTNVYGENRRQRIIINQGVDGQSWVYFQDANNQRWSWTEQGWQTGYTSWGTLPFQTDHQHAIESDGESFVLIIESADGSEELMRTDPVSWENVFVRENADGEDVSTGPFWFYWGEVYVTGEPLPDGGVAGGPYYTADLRTEWLMYRPFVSPEPVATVSP